MLSFLSFLDPLVNPTFIDRENPPVKINLNAKTVGLVAAILGAISALFYLVAIPVVMAIGSAETVFGVATGVSHPGILIIALIGLIGGLVADLLWAVGGYQMYQENHDGKRLVIYSLVLSVFFSLVYDIGTASLAGFIFTLLINGLIYYVVVISRFPDEGPIPGTAGSGTPPPAV